MNLSMTFTSLKKCVKHSVRWRKSLVLLCNEVVFAEREKHACELKSFSVFILGMENCKEVIPSAFQYIDL